MRRALVAFCALWIAGPALAQSKNGSPISKLPVATTPLAGTELIPLVQSGVTKQTPVTNLTGATSSNLFRQTSVPALAAGSLGLAGIATIPTMSANGEGALFLSTTNGVELMGKGSTNDWTLYNSAGATAAWVPTGTRTLSAPYFASLPPTVVLSGSGIPTFQGLFSENLTGASTIVGSTWGANVRIGNSSDNAALADGGVWNELLVNGNFGGTSFSGGRQGIGIKLNLNTISNLSSSTGGLFAIGAKVDASVNAGGTSATYVGSLFGSNPVCQLASGATYYTGCIGEEIDGEIDAGASVGGFALLSTVLTGGHAVQGTFSDTGISIAAQELALVGLRNGFVVGNSQVSMAD